MTTDEQKFGVNVWWSVPAAILDGETVQAILVKHGFDRGDIPLPTRRKEVSRAVRSFHNRRVKEGKRVTDKVRENDDHVTYGILERDVKGAEEVGYDQNTTIYLSKASGDVRVEGVLREPVLEAIGTYEGKVTDEDIRKFLRQIIRLCFGVSKRPGGGIYFVPSRFAYLLKDVQSVLDEIKSGARLYVEGIVDGVQEREIVWESVENSIESDIQQALLAAERIERNAKAVTSQKMKLEGLNEIMEVYKGLLGKEAHYESLTERIEEAVQQVSTKISEIQSGAQSEPKTKAKPKAKTKTKAKAKSGASKPRGSKVYEAVVKALKTEGEPMHYRAITKVIIDNGSYSGKGKYAPDSVRKIVQLAVDGGDTRVVLVRRGIYKAA